MYETQPFHSDSDQSPFSASCLLLECLCPSPGGPHEACHKDPLDLRIAVLSPFVDRPHGGRTLAELLERLVRNHACEIHLYSQNVEDLAVTPFVNRLFRLRDGLLRGIQVD